MPHDREEKRNYFLLMMEGTMWQSFLTLMDPASVVALFLAAMTGSVAYSGLAMTLMWIMPMVGKILFGPYTPRIRRLVRYTAAIKWIRAVFILGLTVPLILHAQNSVSVAVFFVLFALFFLMDGSLEVTMGELRSRIISPRLRGHVMGMSLVTGGLVSIAAGAALSALMANPDLPETGRYAAIFALSGAALVVANIFGSLLRDTSNLPMPDTISLGEFFVRIPRLVREDKALRTFLLAHIPCYFSEIIVNFCVVFSVNGLKLPADQVAWLIMTRIIGIVFGGLLFGEISRRRGNRAVMFVMQLGCLSVALSALAAALNPSLGVMWMVGVCFICGVTAPGWIGRANYLLDIAPVGHRTEYQVSVSLVGAPFGFAGWIAGAVVDRFGFATLFVMCALFACAAIASSRFLLDRRRIEGR